MTGKSGQTWAVVRRQHGVVSRRQLLELGFSGKAIDWRMESGRLYRLHAGVYAVGRRDLTRDGHLIAAVLACGPGAVLSHGSAAELWQIRPPAAGIVVSVTGTRHPRPRNVAVHRRAHVEATRHRGIPVTTPVATLVDLATRLDAEQLERAVNEAINRDLTDPDRLRESLGAMSHRPGAPKLIRLLDRHALTVTDTILEQWFLPIARRAGLPEPLTQVYVNGYRVDFFFPELGIVVEADSLRFHRTPAQQAADRRRDQAHLVASLTPLRFTYAQIRFEPEYVAATLAAVVRQRRAEKLIEEWQR